MASAKITTETFGDVMVVHAPGELTSDTAGKFLDAVTEAVRLGPNAIVLELDQTERFDSTGLESLVDLQDRLHDGGGKLRLCGLSEVGRKIFQMTRLDSKLEVFESVIDAVSSAR
jgi:anti-sigma B factor antagonist